MSLAILSPLQLREESLLKKIESFSSNQERYQWLMRLGNQLSSFPLEYKNDLYLVQGCQSQMYLFTKVSEEKAQFFADSDALISKGLAAFLIEIYQNQKIVDILQHQLVFLEKTQFFDLLTPSRVNGFLSLYKKIKQDLLIQLHSKASNQA